MIQSNVIPKLPSGYTIGQSLRVDSASSAYFSRTARVAGNRKTLTFSTWVKRGNLGTEKRIFDAGDSAGNNFTAITFLPDDKLRVISYVGGVLSFRKDTSQVFRDVSGYYHIQVEVDTTQATASDRIKIKVNGDLVTSFSASTDPTLTVITWIN